MDKVKIPPELHFFCNLEDHEIDGVTQAQGSPDKAIIQLAGDSDGLYQLLEVGDGRD